MTSKQNTLVQKLKLHDDRDIARGREYSVPSKRLHKCKIDINPLQIEL